MQAIPLKKKLFVKATECGSRYLTSDGLVMDSNTCFWNCLQTFLMNTLNINVNLLILKKITTRDLPFDFLLSGNQDPSRINGYADHRVIQKTVELFGINVCLLTSGTHIYNFIAGKEKATMCLLLHRNHFRLVDDDTYIQRMIAITKNPNLDLDFVPEKSSKTRRKRGKKNKGNTYKSVLTNDNEKSVFDEILEETPSGKVLFEAPKRKRGKRRRK